MGITRCGSSCFLKGEDCKGKRDCSCNVCNTLISISPTLYDACSTACNTNDANQRPKTTKQFLEGIGASELFSRYGYVLEGFDPTQTTEYQLQKESQNQVNNQEGFLKTIIFMALGVLFLIGVFIAFKK